MVRLGVGGLIEFNHHGGRRRHTVAMGPHSRQQIIQQSTNMLCGRSTSLKLEKNAFITSDITINCKEDRLPRIVATRCIRRGYHRRHRGPVVVRVDDVLLGSGDGVEVSVNRRRHTSRDVLLCDGG